MGGFETFLFRIASYIHKKIINKNKIKKIFILSENELLIEKTSSLILKNYGIFSLSKIPTEHNNLVDNNLIFKILNMTEQLVKKRIDELIYKSFTKNTYDLFLKEVKNKFILYYQNLQACREYLNKFSNISNDKTFLFTGVPSSLKSLAYSQAFEEKKIKIFSFQHGVTAEISGTHNFNRVFHSSSNKVTIIIHLIKLQRKFVEIISFLMQNRLLTEYQKIF